MSGVLLTVLGAMVGYYLSGPSQGPFGLVVGGLIGWLLHAVHELGEREKSTRKRDSDIRELREHLSDLEQRIQPEERKPAETAPSLSTEPVVEPEVITLEHPVPHPPAPTPVPTLLTSTSESEHSHGHDFGDKVQRALSRVLRWFTTGNVPVKVGVFVSFFGVAFLLKYAVDHQMLAVPIEFRLTGVALAGVVLLAIGWHLRTRMRTYALSLQGGGLGILYLTIFATLQIYQLIPASIAFALMVLLTVFAGFLAVRQDSRALAVLGTLGGFLAPVLASTGSGDHVTLFSYYLVLNVSILGLAFFKAWRELNLLGFLFTYAIGWGWGYDAYRPELLGSTLPFVVLFFFVFLGISVLYAYRRAYRLKDYLDTTIVFGTPVVTFAMLDAMLANTEHDLAISAITMGAVYLLTAALVHWRTTPRHRMLVESFLALGIAFCTLAIPLAFDARWTSASWALEGAALIWIGVRQQRITARACGALLQIAAGASFFFQELGQAEVPLPLLNSDFLGTTLISFAALFGSFYLNRSRELLSKLDRIASQALLGWGVIWWLGGGLVEILSQIESPFRMPLFTVFCAMSLALGVKISSPLRWPAIAWPALGIVPFLVVMLPVSSIEVSHPFDNFGWVTWPLALSLLYWVLWRLEKAHPRWIASQHPPGCWLLAAIGVIEIIWQVEQLTDNSLWVDVAGLTFLCALAQLIIKAPLAWPFSRHRMIYLTGAVGPLVVVTLAGVIVENLRSSGDPAPLGYLPLLNPLDLTGVFITCVLGMWLVALRDRGPGLRDPRIVAWSLTVLTFFLSTATLIRTIHHWGGVPFNAQALSTSVVVHASVSLFWGLLALTAMIVGARKIRRDIWLAGAALMAVVVAKLFLLDLGNSGTLARIVSFIGVGFLLLIVGYFAGVPPRAGSAEPSTELPKDIQE